MAEAPSSLLLGQHAPPGPADPGYVEFGQDPEPARRQPREPMLVAAPPGSHPNGNGTKPRHGCPVPLDSHAVRRSLRDIKDGPGKCAGDFYGYLFAAHPSLREMFPPVMNKQNERLFGALAKIAGLMDRPDAMARYLRQLGVDHRKYGVQPEHYALVGEAMLQALRRHSTSWDERAEAAWTAAYTHAAETMISGAQECEGPASWRGRVLRHELRTRDLAVLDIQTDQPMPFEPGQYVTVQHPKWPNVWRQFSVACPPAPDGDHVELHVRQVSGGWVSTALTKDTGVPTELTLGPPVGTMTPDLAGDRDLLLIAGGSGLAPMKALAADVLSRDESALAGGWGHRRTIHLFHGARNPLDLYDMPWLRELERSYPWLSVVPVVSDDAGFGGLTGNVAEAVAGYGDWSEPVEAYLAGPPEMVTAAAGHLARAGVAPERVHHDEPEDAR